MIVSKLSQLSKLPEVINEDLIFSFPYGNEHILKHLKKLSVKKVNGNVDLSQLRKLSSLEGLGTMFLNEINGEIIIPNTVKSHLLSILKIKKLVNFEIHEIKPTYYSYYWSTKNHVKKDTKPFEILEKYKQTRDILECQAELFENGYRQYAK